MVSHPFTFLAPHLDWLERAMSAVIADDDALEATAGWDKYYAREELVRAAERSTRRAMKVYHCVYGPGQSCHERMIHNCTACAGRPNQAALTAIATSPEHHGYPESAGVAVRGNSGAATANEEGMVSHGDSSSTASRQSTKVP